jgi:hypothetical protein
MCKNVFEMNDSHIVEVVRKRLKDLGADQTFTTIGAQRLTTHYCLGLLMSVEEFVERTDPLELIVLSHCAENIDARIKVDSTKTGLRLRCPASLVLQMLKFLRSVPSVCSVKFRSLVRSSPCGDSCPSLHPGVRLFSRVAENGWCHETCDVYDDSDDGKPTYIENRNSLYCAGVALLKRRKDVLMQIEVRRTDGSFQERG